ncbi:MAG TPA: pantoate--beta-alanine ligase [Acidobacteria bacterium]|nr:pantoate--beta-alanine ligase [Acidobacteriota bacterium]
MQTVRAISEARALRSTARRAGRRVAFVPTMGYLHEGHLALVRRAHELGDAVWVSIFVNPTQFGPNEDFERYPRDLERDAALLEAEGVEVLFAPTVEEMYPREPVVEIAFSGLDRVLCGASRPGHFAGVGLVVAKLFNIVEPDVAVFGQKDAQQALLIRRLAGDLSFPVKIEVAPTVREPDGLAMSSRNTYLSPAERAAAPVLYRALSAASEAIGRGERDPEAVEELLRRTIEAEPLADLEYAVCVDAENLRRPERIDRPVLLALAVRFGATRLIDNLPVEPPEEA